MKRSLSLPAILNKNVEFIDKPESWIFYTLLIIVVRVIIGGFGVSSTSAWTVVNLIHTITSFYLFHWKLGSPFVDDHGEYSTLTFWEQIDDQIQYTRARKFLSVLPFVVFLFACDSAGWELIYVWLNLFLACVCIVPKLPFMHGVRIFGINK